MFFLITPTDVESAGGTFERLEWPAIASYLPIGSSALDGSFTIALR
jgi:hypothetical protein